ncbi:hypothetical protein BGW80DRAFT_1301571 [Lactifluus volemus]|nr:hypothetical protein BGW80DRAFT_1301571 [Lactifluus volemus]
MITDFGCSTQIGSKPIVGRQFYLGPMTFLSYKVGHLIAPATEGRRRLFQLSNWNISCPCVRTPGRSFPAPSMVQCMRLLSTTLWGFPPLVHCPSHTVSMLK